MDPDVAEQLAQQCLPALQVKGVSNIKAVAKAKSRHIQGVWTGEGGIAEITAEDDDGATATIIAKSIGTYKNCDDMELQDHWSYYNEVTFYESDLPDRMCAAGVPCPRPLFVERKPSGQGQRGRKSRRASSAQTSDRTLSLLRRFRVKSEDGGEEQDEAVICMTKLAGGRWSSSRAEAALSWLARLHALFWGNERADAAVAAGISDQTGFWHLDNRSIELGRMGGGPLRLAAAGVDARLKADSMQTLCHGDPKGANIMWDEDQGVTMYDFQWFGKGPPSKDLVYFLATAAMNGGRWDSKQEERYLRCYHGELSALLEKQGDKPPAFEHLHDSYRLACFDYRRWQEGGFSWGNVALLDANTEYVLSRLNSGTPPKSEAEYHDRIFECFPP
mmetsp:Transcript_16640/g.47444  ORF Transcript_16640/g.47444 Transcript_16640/m.47444 type:complete len:389 (+) Transcript_16640:59-1225(+)